MLLLDHRAIHFNFPHQGTALLAAAKCGNIEMVRNLLEEGVGPCDEDALLHAASEEAGMLDILLQAFIERYRHGMKGYGCMAIAKATEERNDALQDVLLRANPYFDRSYYVPQDGWRTPLSVAIQNSRLTIVKKLLDLKVDPNCVILDTLVSAQSAGPFS